MTTSKHTPSIAIRIRPAINGTVALGFIRVTRKGSVGNAEFRQSTLFLVTYLPAGSNQVVEDGWRRIQTIEEAEAVSKHARAKKADAKAREFGQRGARQCGPKNKCPVMETALKSVQKPHQTPVMEIALKDRKSSVQKLHYYPKVSRGGSLGAEGLSRRRTCG